MFLHSIATGAPPLGRVVNGYQRELPLTCMHVTACAKYLLSIIILFQMGHERSKSKRRRVTTPTKNKESLVATRRDLRAKFYSRVRESINQCVPQ